MPESPSYGIGEDPPDAKRHGVTVSVDLNFRKKLWTKEKAQSIMKPLMQFVDVCIGNEEDAELCLGFKIGRASCRERV